MKELLRLLRESLSPEVEVLASKACRESLALLAKAATPKGAQQLVESALLPLLKAALAEGWTREKAIWELAVPFLRLCTQALSAGEFQLQVPKQRGLEALLPGILPERDLGYFFYVLLPGCAPAVVRQGWEHFAVPLYKLAKALCLQGRRLEEWLSPLVEWQELTAVYGLEVLLRWWQLDARFSPPAERLKALSWWADRLLPQVTRLLAAMLEKETDPSVWQALTQLLAQRPDGEPHLLERLKKEHRPFALAAILRALLKRTPAQSLWAVCRENSHLSPFWPRVAASTLPPLATPPKTLFTFHTKGKVYAAPWAENGILFVACCDRKIYALDARSGSPLWEFTAGEEIYTSPCSWRGILYFGCHDGKVYALEMRSGKKLWDYATEGVIFSSPVVANGTLYVGSYDCRLYALDARTGALKWAAATGGGIRSTPFVTDGCVLVGSEDWRVYAFCPLTGRLLWQVTTSGPVRSSPVVAGETVYAGTADGRLYALDVKTGTTRWVFKTRGSLDAAPCYHQGLLYVASRGKRVCAVDALTGKGRWVFRAQDEICASPAIHGQTLYVAAKSGRLYALSAVNGRCLWHFHVGGHVYAALRLANGILYVGTHNHRVLALEIDPFPEEQRAREDLLCLLSLLGEGGEEWTSAKNS